MISRHTQNILDALYRKQLAYVCVNLPWWAALHWREYAGIQN